MRRQGMKTNIKGINLLPKEYIRAEQIKYFKIIGAGILTLEILGFIGFVAIPPKIEAKRLQQKLDEVALEITDPRFTNVNQTIQQLEDTKAEVDEWLLKYGDLSKENFISVKVLDSLTARVPIGVTINGMTLTPEASDTGEYGQRTIAIKGTATQLLSVINYVAVIESVYGADAATYEANYNEGLGVYDYTITVNILTQENAVDEGSQENVEAKEADAQ